jgi:hypothetical protein
VKLRKLLVFLISLPCFFSGLMGQHDLSFSDTRRGLALKLYRNNNPQISSSFMPSFSVSPLILLENKKSTQSQNRIYMQKSGKFKLKPCPVCVSNQQTKSGYVVKFHCRQRCLHHFEISCCLPSSKCVCVCM